MYEAEGLLFETEAEANQAKKEAEGIEYIKERTKMDDPDVILNLYHNLLEKRLFNTEVGLRFLFELQDYLRGIPYIKSEDIKPIPAVKEFGEQKKEQKKERKEPVMSKARESRLLKKYKARFRVSFFFAVVFFAAVVGMFTVLLTSDNARELMEKENAIVDKYEEWQEELEIREQELDQREAQLKNK